MTARMRESFRKRVDRGDKYPLLWALHETLHFEFYLGGALAFIATIFQVMSLFTLRFLIQFADDAYVAANQGTTPPPIARGIGLVVGVTCMQIVQSLGTNHFLYRGMMVGGQSRTVLIGLIFEKAMVLSGRAKAGGQSTDKAEKPKSGKNTKGGKEKGEKRPETDTDGWANGRITNLMSVDTQRIDLANGFFHMLWLAPLSAVITLAMLIVNLSYSALTGFALLVLGVPLLTRAIRSLFKRRKTINAITDQRVSLTQEILQSVRFVKFFGWETAFLDRLKAIRKREIYSIQILLSIRNAINAVSMSLPIFASLLSFVTYSLSGNDMNPAEVFSSLALLNGLRIPLNLLPLVLGQVVDAWSSMKRIQDFLMAEEIVDDTTYKLDGPNAMELNDASFTWEKTAKQDGKGLDGQEKKGAKEKKEKTEDSAGEDASTLVEEREQFKLHEVNLALGRNELVAIIGTVGSGKSSLLAALAGDMRKTAGEVVLGASRAFCPQYAWIQNTTLQENILFGKEIDRGRYGQVIDA